MDVAKAVKRISLAVLFLGTVAVLWWLVARNVRDFEETVIRQTQQHLLTSAELEANRIETMFEDMQAELELLALNPIVHNRITRNIAISQVREGEYDPSRAMFEHIRPNTGSFYRIDSKGTVQRRIPFAEGREGSDFSTKPGVRFVLENHEAHVSEVLTTNSGRNALSICVPVFQDEEFIGILRALVYLDTVNDIISHVKAGEKGYAWIVDDEGTMIAHPEPEYIGEDIIEKRKEALPDHDWSELENIVARMSDGEEGVGIYNSVWWDKDEPRIVRKLIAFAPIRLGKEQWSIAVSMDYDEISGPVKAHARNLFIAAGFVILIFAGIGFRFYRIQRRKASLELQAKSAEKLRALNERLKSEIAERKEVEEALVHEIRRSETVAAELEERVVELDSARRAALNMMEDAETARKEMEQSKSELEQSREAALSIMEDAEAAREQAERSRDRIEAMLRSIGDGVLVVDIDRKIMMINRAAEKITGWTDAEVVGKPADEVFNIVNEQTGEKMVSPLEEVFTNHETLELSEDVVVINKDGDLVPVADSSAPITDREGKIIGAILVFRDVTETRRAEQEKEELQTQFFQAQKMESIGILAGGIAHDFNNILQGILGYTGMIKSRLDEDDENYPHISLVEMAAERAAGLTQQLLSFARKGKYDVVSIDPEVVVDQVISLARRTFKKDVEIVREFEKDLLRMRGDRAQVHQALMNICINAVDAMPEGGTLRIDVRNMTLEQKNRTRFGSVSPGTYVLFTVQDTGVGMDEETLSRIFEPFFTTKGAAKGTGLGLAMVFGVVKNHDGAIDVVSEPGKGTTFKLLFPAEESSNDAEPRHEKGTEHLVTEGKPPDRSRDNSETTILIIDDEEIVRYVASDMLVMMGYKTITAAEGQEGARIYSERRDEIDVVLLDMIMPKMSGLETFRELRKIDPEARVIIASGYEEDERSQTIMNEGAAAYLRKPYLMGGLMSVIEQALRDREPVPFA